jgi:2-aminoadipate transaminase
MTKNFPRILNKFHIRLFAKFLNVAGRENMISFAGGLPNPDYFPIEALQLSASEVLVNMVKKYCNMPDRKGICLCASGLLKGTATNTELILKLKMW